MKSISNLLMITDRNLHPLADYVSHWGRNRYTTNTAFRRNPNPYSLKSGTVLLFLRSFLLGFPSSALRSSSLRLVLAFLQHFFMRGSLQWDSWTMSVIASHSRRSRPTALAQIRKEFSTDSQRYEHKICGETNSRNRQDDFPSLRKSWTSIQQGQSKRPQYKKQE